MAKKINRSKVILSDLVDKKTVERILKTFHKTFGFGCSCVDGNNWESVRESSNRITMAEPFTECLLNEHNKFEVWLSTIWECDVSKQILQSDRIID